jgi:succinate-semialdehyde dehydrogenase / glutarate-semialdehyde dehydrogenase
MKKNRRSSAKGFVVSYQQMYIGGQWVDAIGGERLKVVNPATEEVIAEVPWGHKDDCAKAIAAAHAALPAWGKTTVQERAKILKKAGDLLRERIDSIAKILTSEQGKPLAEAKAEVLHSADTLEWFAEEGKRAYGQIIPAWVAGKRHMTLKHPVGVVGGIGPWNFPITQHVRKIAPALAAGCTIVSKPADPTPLSLLQLIQCLIDAGVPSGVVNCVIGPGEEIATEFMENPKLRKVSFTGSTRVGKILMRQSADQVKRLSLELGGHAPLIVFPDADPEMVAKAAVAGKFRNNGQVCISPSRFYVHKDLQKKFTEVAVETARAIVQGNGMDASTQLGPMIARRALETTTELVGDATHRGAKLLTGGKKSAKFDKGYFFEPTILTDIPHDARLLSDEPFAPVMPVLGFENIEEVLERANATKYGLAAYVFTNDLTTTWRMAEGLEAGIIGINDPIPATPQCPFGGMKESGIGRELAHEGLEAYMETKFISLKLRD